VLEAVSIFERFCRRQRDESAPIQGPGGQPITVHRHNSPAKGVINSTSSQVQVSSKTTCNILCSELNSCILNHKNLSIALLFWSMPGFVESWTWLSRTLAATWCVQCRSQDIHSRVRKPFFDRIFCYWLSQSSCQIEWQEEKGVHKRNMFWPSFFFLHTHKVK